MKKIILCCLMAVMGVVAGATATAAEPTKKETRSQVETTVFRVDIDCNHCVQKIMNNVPAIGKGIKDVQVDLPKKEATVSYDRTKTSPEELVKGFAKIKVKAEVKE